MPRCSAWTDPGRAPTDHPRPRRVVPGANPGRPGVRSDGGPGLATTGVDGRRCLGRLGRRDHDPHLDGMAGCRRAGGVLHREHECLSSPAAQDRHGGRQGRSARCLASAGQWLRRRWRCPVRPRGAGARDVAPDREPRGFSLGYVGHGGGHLEWQDPARPLDRSAGPSRDERRCHHPGLGQSEAG
jgi:hypothetical protein